MIKNQTGINFTMAYLILIVEDEPKLSRSVAEYLESSGYQTHIIDNGNLVVDWVRHNEPTLILLDLMLPEKDGISICQEVRTFSQVPIIMASAKTDEIDRLVGLEIGADDYLCKPFSLREVVARVKAVIRRHEHTPHKIKAEISLELDKSSSCVLFNKHKTELTAIEFNILTKLHQQPGKIFKRNELMDSAYEDGRIVNDRTVDSHMKKIRKKLAGIAPSKKFLHAIYGVGYKFEP
jgi:two-component system response regulator BaeR